MRHIIVFTLCLMPLCSNAQFNTDRLMMTGRSALYYEDYVLSIQYFNQILNVKPYLYEPWYLRGVAKFYLDDFIGAENDVDKAIELNPYIGNMYELRGLCRIRQNNYDGAIDDYDKTLSMDARNYSVWYNRTLCRIEKKDYQRAQCDLDTMIAHWKDNAASYSLKAEVFLMQSDTTSADSWLDKSLTIDPYNADAWTARAMIKLSRHDWKWADEYLGKAIHLKPNNAGHYINRGLARYNLNNLRGAMSDYDKAIDLDPNNFLGHYNRGLLRMQLGDDNRAIDDFYYIIKLEPNNVMALFNRAQLHDKTGNPRAAIDDYTKVIDQFPNFWTGLSLRANCYRKLGMTAKAELDEFRILKAQLDKQQGKKTKWSKSKSKQMRKRSEIDLDKYNQIVVADENNVEHEFESEYRGRIQNRSVDNTFRPMYHLSFVKYDNGVKSYQAFSDEVERLNKNNPNAQRIYVNCNTMQLNDAMSAALFARIDTLSAQIDATRNVAEAKQMILERAICYTATQDYISAINDLDTYLGIDPSSVLALWQRAYCLTRSNSFNAARGVDIQLNAAKAMADIDMAIKADPSNQYLRYNRANMHVYAKDYANAIDDYTEAIRIDANLAEAYYNRGLACINIDKRQEGIRDLSKAGELGLYDAYGLMKKYSAEKKK